MEEKFLKHLPSLYLHTMRLPYGHHAGESEDMLNDLETERGIAPASLYASLPFVIEGGRDLHKDSHSSEAQKQRLRDLDLRLIGRIHLILTPKSCFKAVGPAGNGPETLTFSTALGGLSLLPFLGEKAPERIFQSPKNIVKKVLAQSSENDDSYQHPIDAVSIPKQLVFLRKLS